GLPIVTSGRARRTAPSPTATSGFGWRPADDREALARTAELPWAAAGGVSPALGRLGRCAQGGQKSTDHPADAPWREARGRRRPFPGQALVGHQGPGQPELPEGR